MIFARKLISNVSILIIVFAIIASIILGSPNIIIISVSILILNKLFSPLLSSIVLDSKVYSSILIFFCYIILLQCSVLISWAINHNFPLTYIPMLSLIIILIIYYYNYFITRSKTKHIKFAKDLKKINVADIISLTIATGVCLTILLAPLIQNPVSDTKSTIAMSLVNGNVDDAAHIGLVNDYIQFNRAVLFGSDAQNTRNTGFYPVSWHSISAMFIKILYPSITTGSESLLAYGIQKLFWSFLMFFLLIRSSFVMFKFAIGDRLKPIFIYWLTGSTTLLSCIFLLPIVREGFYSLFPQLVTSMLAIPLLIQVCVEKSKFKIIPIILLVFIGGCLSWLLPLPAFGIALISVLIWLVWDKKIKIIAQNLFNVIKQNTIIIVVLLTAVIAQLLIMFSNKADGSVSFVQGIILDGGITQYSSEFYLFIIVGFLTCIFFAKSKAKKNIYMLLSLPLSILLFCIVIYLLQMIYIGRSAYYFYKIIDILISIIIPFSAVGMGIIIQKICGVNNTKLITALTTIVLGITFIVVGPKISAIAYAGGYRDFPNDVSGSIYNKLSSEITQEHYTDKKSIFYYVPGPESFVQNEVANMLAKSNAPDSDCFNKIRLFLWQSPPIDSLLLEIDKQCPNYSAVIVTDKKNFDIFYKATININLSKSITIQTY